MHEWEVLGLSVALERIKLIETLIVEVYCIVPARTDFAINIELLRGLRDLIAPPLLFPIPYFPAPTVVVDAFEMFAHKTSKSVVCTVITPLASLSGNSQMPVLGHRGGGFGFRVSFWDTIPLCCLVTITPVLRWWLACPRFLPHSPISRSSAASAPPLQSHPKKGGIHRAGEKEGRHSL